MRKVRWLTFIEAFKRRNTMVYHRIVFRVDREWQSYYVMGFNKDGDTFLYCPEKSVSNRFFWLSDKDIDKRINNGEGYFDDEFKRTCLEEVDFKHTNKLFKAEFKKTIKRLKKEGIIRAVTRARLNERRHNKGQDRHDTFT